MATYQVVVLTPFHSQLSGQASFVLYIHIAGHFGYTSHSSVVLGLVLVNVRNGTSS